MADNTDWGSAEIFTHPSTNTRIAKVLPGYYYLSPEDLVISTVLGSCVCACIRDPMAGVGGMNHYMLPDSIARYVDGGDARHPNANRYGKEAMDNLIEALINKGAQLNRLEVKLFGGGRVLDINSNVGDDNASFGVQYCESRGLLITSQNLGDEFPRKVNYNPTTGKVKMLKLRGAYTGMVAGNEIAGLEGL